MPSIAIAAFSNVFAPEIWTESRLARALNFDAMKLHRAYRAGTLRPDYVAGRTRLYKPQRIDELREALHPATP